MSHLHMANVGKQLWNRYLTNQSAGLDPLDLDTIRGHVACPQAVP